MFENLILLGALFFPVLVVLPVVIYKAVRESIDPDYADKQKMKRDRYRS